MKLVNTIAYLLGIVGYCCADYVMTDGTGFPICSLHLKSKTWEDAKNDCENAGKFLLCYNSKVDVEKILKAFQMFDGPSRQRLWLSSRTCAPDKEIAECLILNIHRGGKGVGHYFERNCSTKLSFICCSKDAIVPETTSPMDEISTSMVSKRDDDTTSITSTITETSSTPEISYCEPTKKIGVLLPRMPAGSTVSMPCPGNSRGYATWSCSRTISYDWSPVGPNIDQCHSKD